MPRAALRLATSAPVSRSYSQMSRPKGFAPLRPQLRVVAPMRRVLPRLGRAEARRFWSALVIRRCRSVRDGALRFEVTDQTVRNWMAAHCSPTGEAVLAALMWWPEDFAGLSHQFRGR